MTPAEHDERESGLTRRLRTPSGEFQVLDRGHGMPVVMVHGFPLDHSMWDAQIAQLSQRWRVVAPDMRGFGGSQVTPGTVTMQQMADDLAAILDESAIDAPIVLCGLSMGGYVALAFWRKYAARLRGLVLCDTRAAADTPEAAAGRLQTVERLFAEGNAPLADAMLPKLFAAATLEKHPNVSAIERQKILGADPQGLAAALRGMAKRHDFRGELAHIALPTLVIVGQHDAISPVDEMRSIAGAIPEAEFVIVPEAGHMAPLENPDGFNEAIEQFLTRVERRG